MDKFKTMFVTPNGRCLTVISSDDTLQFLDLRTGNKIQWTKEAATTYTFLVNWNYDSPGEVSHVR